MDKKKKLAMKLGIGTISAKRNHKMETAATGAMDSKEMATDSKGRPVKIDYLKKKKMDKSYPRKFGEAGNLPDKDKARSAKKPVKPHTFDPGKTDAKNAEGMPTFGKYKMKKMGESTEAREKYEKASKKYKALMKKMAK